MITSPKPAPRHKPPPRAPPIQNLLDEGADADSAFRWAGAIGTEVGQDTVLPDQVLGYRKIDDNPRAGHPFPNIRSVSTASGLHSTQEPEHTPAAATVAATAGLSKGGTAQGRERGHVQGSGVPSYQGYSQRPAHQDGGHIALRSGWLPACTARQDIVRSHSTVRLTEIRSTISQHPLPLPLKPLVSSVCVRSDF